MCIPINEYLGEKKEMVFVLDNMYNVHTYLYIHILYLYKYIQVKLTSSIESKIKYFKSLTLLQSIHV